MNVCPHNKRGLIERIYNKLKTLQHNSFLLHLTIFATLISLNEIAMTRGQCDRKLVGSKKPRNQKQTKNKLTKDKFQ